MNDIVQMMQARREEILHYINGSMSEREKLGMRSEELTVGIGKAEKDIEKLDRAMEILEPSQPSPGRTVPFDDPSLGLAIPPRPEYRP